MQTLTSPEALRQVADEMLARWMPQREERNASRRRRREQWLEAFAKSYVLAGDRDHVSQRAVVEFLPQGVHPPTPRQFRSAGGVCGVYGRIARGGLGIDDRLGVWIGGFVRGLRLSGALRKDAGRGWAVWESTHRILLADLQSMPLPHRLESGGHRNGIRRLRRCPASSLPPDDDSGVDVLAGLFAGAIHVRANGFDWLELPADPEVLRLLDLWTVHHRISRMFRGQERIAVSPFYGSLVSPHMPPFSARRVLGMKRPGDCPLLPLIHWDSCLSTPKMRWAPFAGDLPFGCSRRTALRRGWKRRNLHRQCVLDLGLTHIDRRIGSLCEEWFARRAKGRLVNNSVERPAPLAESAPYPTLVALPT